jgi:hypothetical protein
MGNILEVRLEDGSVAQIDQSLIGGASFEGIAPAMAVPLVIDTKLAPPAGEGSFLVVNFSANDPIGNKATGGQYLVQLRKSTGGVLALAGGAQQVGGALVGDAALETSTLAFSVSAGNTLVMTFTGEAGYANPLNFVATIATGTTA